MHSRWVELLHHEYTMASRRELALKVEEPAAGGFLWVLMEACDMQGSDVFHYRVVRKASHPQAAYWDAMVLGMAELRRIMAVDAGMEVERQS
jgi:hypothetical protein